MSRDRSALEARIARLTAQLDAPPPSRTIDRPDAPARTGSAKCIVTGRRFEYTVRRKGGRPPDYSSPAAKLLENSWTRFERALSDVRGEMTADARREWASRLWSARNTLQAGR